MGDLIIPQFDTPSDQQVSISLDIGIVPWGYPGAGQHIITIQAWPIPSRREADRVALALREAINSKDAWDGMKVAQDQAAQAARRECVAGTVEGEDESK